MESILPNLSWNYQDFTVHEFENLQSTNKTAFEFASLKREFDKTVIKANIQTAGKGRGGNVWSSPKGNLYFSLILTPKINISNITQMPIIACAALRETLAELSCGLIPNDSIKNKWPNDILINTKKVAGILVESKISHDLVEFIIIGIGVNVMSHPNDSNISATNLNDNKINVNANDVLQRFLSKFDEIYQNWMLFGFTKSRNLWSAASNEIGKKIMFLYQETLVEGIFQSIDDYGRMVVKNLATKELMILSHEQVKNCRVTQ